MSEKIVPKPRPQKKGGDGENDKWDRDEREVKNCLKNADYKCEINSSHYSFTSDKTKKNYLEAHHLIPMQFQENYEYSLDVGGNLVALCPNCHKKIHLAVKEEQIELIEYLYNIRRDMLEMHGLKITLEELSKLY